jgi:hypothetical protein
MEVTIIWPMRTQAEDAERKIDELTELVSTLTDEEVGYVFGRGGMDRFLRALLDPKTASNYPSLAEFLLANKWRATLMTSLRHVITAKYAFRSSAAPGYVCAHYAQWFADGVMLTEGQRPFEGSMGLYRNGQLSFAVAAGDVRPGEILGPERFQFIDADELNARRKTLALSSDADLDKPGDALRQLLDAGVNDEASYQNVLEQHPWILGAQYRSMMRHEKLDDQNIPDFTGVRVHDSFRDIIEVKPPFMKVFRNDGTLSHEFNDAWNQVERYLEFARDEKDYLRRRGLSFSSPACILIAGYGLTDDQIHLLRRKERLNPAIRLLTYNGLLEYAANTGRLLRHLSQRSGDES